MLSSQFPQLSSPPSLPPSAPCPRRPSIRFERTAERRCCRRRRRRRRCGEGGVVSYVYMLQGQRGSRPASNGVVRRAGGREVDSVGLRACGDPRALATSSLKQVTSNLDGPSEDPAWSLLRRHEQRGRCDLHFTAFRSNALFLPTCHATQVTVRSPATNRGLRVAGSAAARARADELLRSPSRRWCGDRRAWRLIRGVAGRGRRKDDRRCQTRFGRFRIRANELCH